MAKRDVKRNLIADSVRVSDVVILNNGIWERDSDETDKRKKEVKKLMDSVWED